jgi:hypothetical protein
MQYRKDYFLSKRKIEDLTGMKFNRLTVISLSDKTNKRHDRYWLCECDCENKTRKLISEYHLRRGTIKSCGCLSREWTTNKNKERAFTNKLPNYNNIRNSYEAMYKRCYDETHDGYKYYGGRGITICNEWLNNYKEFYKWAINNGYKKNLTIERIDVDGNYEPTNCCWATMKEQCYNKTNTLYIYLDGKFYTIEDLCKESGLSYSVIWQRYRRFNKNTKEELIKPLRGINT